jgi:hypothetical protein
MSRHEKFVRILAVCCLPIAMTGCAAIEVLHESAQCGGATQRQAILLADQAALDALWQGLPATTPAGRAPTADFQGKSILYLADDERSSAGYGLSLASPHMTVNLGVASLHLETAVPAGMTAQVITRPCLLLALPGNDYRRVEALDQSGRVWAAAERRD